MDGPITRKKSPADAKTWRAQTKAVRSGQTRSNFDETSEALFLTSGYVYPSAEEAETTFKGDGHPLPVLALRQSRLSAMFENRLVALEGAEACRATSTGMSAIFFAAARLPQER